MKILVYGINFYPELTGIGKYTGEMVEWLAAQGHDVRVVCGPPYYPNWHVDRAYSRRGYMVESILGACVYRVPMWVPAKPKGLKRVLHLLSFALMSFPALLAQLKWKPDVVWTVEPALAGIPFALLVGRLCKAKTWIHIQDFEVDAAFELGILKGRAMRSVVERFEAWLYGKADRVSSISQNMLARAKSKGVDSARLFFFPNWVDLAAISPLKEVSSYRSELNIGNLDVVALYSGNMGAKQGLGILGDVARLLQHVDNIHFVFCGNGPGRLILEEGCVGLDNVTFLDLQPFERLNQLLGLADIHMLPQSASAADLVMPSKLIGMLASARPVVATASPDTELGRVVSAVGVAVPPGDAQALADAVETLARSAARRLALGNAGRNFAERELGRDFILRRFEAELELIL